MTWHHFHLLGCLIILVHPPRHLVAPAVCCADCSSHLTAPPWCRLLLPSHCSPTCADCSSHLTAPRVVPPPPPIYYGGQLFAGTLTPDPLLSSSPPAGLAPEPQSHRPLPPQIRCCRCGFSRSVALMLSASFAQLRASSGSAGVRVKHRCYGACMAAVFVFFHFHACVFPYVWPVVVHVCVSPLPTAHSH